jgi:general secretion pathway protein G
MRPAGHERASDQANRMNTKGVKQRASSLIEVIVVVVILGVLAAIAIPRFSQAATSDEESNLRAGLAVLRTAIELYYRDHGAYPGQEPAGLAGAEAGTAAAVIRQLTQYTDADGRAAVSPSADFSYGPYLRRGIPSCPVAPGGPSARIHTISGTDEPACCAAAADAGWIYNPNTGYIAANSNKVDSRGVRYDTY